MTPSLVSPLAGSRCQSLVCAESAPANTSSELTYFTEQWACPASGNTRSGLENSELFMAEPSTRSFKLPQPNKATQKGLLLAIVVAVVTAIVVVLLKYNWTSSAPTNQVSDPSIVIGTFITLYG